MFATYGCLMKHQRPIDPQTEEFVERRQREGTIADRRDNGTLARQKWSRVLNIAFVVTTSIALVGPAVMSSYFGISIHTVTTGSMRPAINPGDMIVAKVVTASNLRANDVVMLVNPENWSLQSHRIQSLSSTTTALTITTKGDSNPVADKPVDIGLNSPVRKVVQTIPKFGYVVSALSSTRGKTISFLFLIIFNVIIVSNVLVKRRKEDKKKNQISPAIYEAEKRENA